MAPHPEPSPTLASQKLPITVFKCPWYRIHRLAYGALFFDRSLAGRFNAPSKEFGVLYVGRDERCAFIETLARATGVSMFDPAVFAERGLVRVRCSQPLRLVDLRSKGLARIRADASLTAGPDYDLAHRWSKALHDHPSRPHGIAYVARHDQSLMSAALFEDRVPLHTLSTENLGALDSNPERLADWLQTYGFSLLPP